MTTKKYRKGSWKHIDEADAHNCFSKDYPTRLEGLLATENKETWALLGEDIYIYIYIRSGADHAKHGGGTHRWERRVAFRRALRALEPLKGRIGGWGVKPLCPIFLAGGGDPRDGGCEAFRPVSGRRSS